MSLVDLITDIQDKRKRKAQEAAFRGPKEVTMPDGTKKTVTLDDIDKEKKDKIMLNSYARINIENREAYNYLPQTQYENPLHISSETFSILNKYKGTLEFTTAILQGPAKDGKVVKKSTTTKNADGQDVTDVTTTVEASKVEVNRIIYDTIAAPSLFNPIHAVQAKGITPNVPLLDTSQNGDSISAKTSSTKDVTLNSTLSMINTDDCSISRLVELSAIPNGPLGMARYKYSDFMYCADVGKISNNRLITLRRFSLPIKDNIFYPTSIDDDSNLSNLADIGRLITWFGTEDNKLEDILKYTVETTWKQLEAKIQEQHSQESDPARGVVGGLVNLFSKSYNKSTEAGVAPSALSLLMGEGGSSGFTTSAPYADNPAVLGSMDADRNKVYEPQDTLRSMEVPAGELKFSHEFSLTFRYKLRGYDNINAKSAFLDLLANILVVTYKTGQFWAGERRVLGAPPNPAGWKKAQKFLDKSYEAGGTFISNILNGGDFGDSLNQLGQSLAGALNSSFGIDFSQVLSDPKAALTGLLNKAKEAGFGGALKGMIGNQLGRPAVYVFDSLLSGDDSGPWHVTIGNPLNPIASFGNLIMGSAEISHSGPLGLDDFPTELKVVCNLRHARPRDSVDIQRMYTQGKTAIYSQISNSKNYSKKFEWDPQTAATGGQTASGAQATATNQPVTLDLGAEMKAVIDPMCGWVGDNKPKRITANKTNIKS